MGRRSPFTEEFRREAVTLFRAAGGKRTYAALAAESGVTGETLRTWVRKDAGANVPTVPGERVPESQTGGLIRLRAENARLVKAGKGWHLEREILRRADACPAGEVQ